MLIDLASARLSVQSVVLGQSNATWFPRGECCGVVPGPHGAGLVRDTKRGRGHG